MINTIIVASGIGTAFVLVFYGLYVRFGRAWNSRRLKPNEASLLRGFQSGR